jgi:hypothetical protein
LTGETERIWVGFQKAVKSGVEGANLDDKNDGIAPQQPRSQLLER